MSQSEPPGVGSIVWFGTILPFFYFWAMTGGVAEWQSGVLEDYVSVFFSAEVGVSFLPWYLFAAASAFAFDDEPEKSAWVTRLGLLSGVVLSLTYLGAFLLRTGGNASYFLAPAVLVGMAAWLGRLPWTWMRAAIAVLPLLGLFLAASWGGSPGNPAALAVVYIFVFFAGTPLWAFFLYSHLLGCAIVRAPRRPMRVWSVAGTLAWIAGYVGTLLLALRKMEEVYAQLPTSPPESCYVATAAARGHRALVGTRQLKHLKAAELVLRRRAPRWHRAMRAVYDRWGPALARRISHPLLADLAYLSLKLPEALACGILCWEHYTLFAYTQNAYYSRFMADRDEIHALLPLRPLEFLVLAVLDQAPLHGYAMAERIEARTDGVMKVRPGDLYRVLYRLQKRRLLASRPGDERRTVYSLTPLGRRVLDAEARLLRGVVAGVGKKRKERPA